jgi:molecular chaperone IbpA
MRNITLTSPFDELFRDFNRFSVGFEPTWRMLDQVRTTQNSGYPPYDLESTDENTYRLSMAVAGFTADDLDITLQDGVLTIEGRVKQDESRNFLHKGIAGRSFRRTFYLNAWVQVTGSNLNDGILTVDFVQEIPESLKPRKISIGTSQAEVKVLDGKTSKKSAA